MIGSSEEVKINKVVRTGLSYMQNIPNDQVLLHGPNFRSLKVACETLLEMEGIVSYVRNAVCSLLLLNIMIRDLGIVMER